MNRLAFPWTYVVILIVVTLIVAMFLRRDEIEVRSLDGPISAEQELCDRFDRCDQLDVVLATTRVGSQARAYVAQDVIAGRLNLLEAAERFRTLSIADSHYNWRGFYTAFPFPTEEERFCRHVITVVKAELIDRELTEAVDVAERLETELETHLANGTLRLTKKGGPYPRPSGTATKLDL